MIKASVVSLIMVLLIFLPQNLPGRNNTLQNEAINTIVNDFLQAVNSGNREAMQDFVISHYDQNMLKQIPSYIIVSFNRSFYYESGGMDYKLLNILPMEQGFIMAELYNTLTETKMKFKIPVTEAPSYKIRGLITHEIITPVTKENQDNRFSDDEIIVRTEQCLKKLAEDDEFSGAVLVVKNGKTLLKNAIGQASREYDIPNKTTTKFNMASVGKMFTGLAIVKLVEQGILSFDDPISKYVPEDWLNPEISRKIQIRHLLTHTSGLGDYFKNAYTQCAIPFFRNLEDYKSLVVHDTLMFDPGTKFSYSNTGMLLLGVVIENVTGTDYFTYLRNNIFEPAGMVNTDGFDKSIPVKNRATGYSKEYFNAEVNWNNHQYTRIMRGSPSGGIYSTVEDLLKFDMAIRLNTLLSPLYTKMLLEGRPELNASFHSYGFFVSEGYLGRQISHGGDGQGVNCQFKMFYDLGYTFAVLSNFSQPSANIVANVLDQLISHGSGISQ